tara:strand:- start:14483 stop:15310 length:828 start_codon:yes stop_codon:yes gene_type:complete
MKISVVIPTFNRLSVLARALDSAINQTIKPHEIIVIDDGSSDQTRNWIRNKFPEINYFYQKNMGVSTARNTGIDMAKGDWIAFLDSDDEWDKAKLELQSKAIHNNKDIPLSHTNEIWIKNGVRINQKRGHQKFGGQIFNRCLKKCIISPSTVIIRKDIFNEIGLFDTSLPVCEDYDLWLRVTARYPVLLLEKELTIKYGGHSDQLSNIDSGIEKYHIISLEKLLLKNFIDPVFKKNAKETLLQKLEIYSSGLKKRNKVDDIAKFDKKIKFWNSYN